MAKNLALLTPARLFSAILFLFASAARAGTPYHAIVVSGVVYAQVGGAIESGVLNNRVIIRTFTNGVPGKTQRDYTLILNDVTGEVDLYDKVTRLIVGAPVLVGTSVISLLANPAKTLNYIEATIYFGDPSLAGTAFSVEKRDAQGNLLSDHVSFSVSKSDTIFRGTFVTTGKKYSL